jgi:hypothetical protein
MKHYSDISELMQDLRETYSSVCFRLKTEDLNYEDALCKYKEKFGEDFITDKFDLLNKILSQCPIMTD